MLKKIIIYSDDGIISFLQDEKQFVSFIMGKFCPCRTQKEADLLPVSLHQTLLWACARLQTFWKKQLGA